MKYWIGEVPPEDDFGHPITDCFVDGKTNKGPWALMAYPHTHSALGIGLGTGRGQLYEKQEDGRWLKIQEVTS